MVRALALALIFTWLFASAAAACEPLPPGSLSGSTSGGVRAQVADATPATPGPTDPAACTVAPRTLPELRQLINEGARAGATPDELTLIAMEDLPAGEPADIATIAAITATTEQVMACINASDILRMLSLFSDEFVRNDALALGLTPEDLSNLTMPQPMDKDEWVALGEVTNARVLPDGSIGAIISPAPPNDDEPAFFIFVQEGDRWLVDSFADIEVESGDGPCCAEPSPAPAKTWQPVEGDGFQGVIVPEADAPLFFRALDGTEPAGYWTPSASDVDQLEADLFFFLTPRPCGESPAPDQIWQELDSFRRQYAGFVAADGRNLILVNAFCTTVGLDWRSQPVAVNDGGACFFQITYDPTTGDFTDLRVNGEA